MRQGDRVLGTAAVRAMIGGVRVMTLWRWVRELGFPRPFKVGESMNGWWESEVLAWLEKRAAEGRAVSAPSSRRYLSRGGR